MPRWRDRAVHVDPSTLNRDSIAQLLANANALGFTARETSCLDIDGTVMVTLSGYGEDFEAYFRAHLKTGYLRWDHGNKLSDYSADRIPTLGRLLSSMSAARQAAIELGWNGETGS